MGETEAEATDSPAGTPKSHKRYNGYQKQQQHQQRHYHHQDWYILNNPILNIFIICECVCLCLFSGWPDWAVVFTFEMKYYLMSKTQFLMVHHCRIYYM